jgi:hypothetical protein
LLFSERFLTFKKHRLVLLFSTQVRAALKRSNGNEQQALALLRSEAAARVKKVEEVFSRQAPFRRTRLLNSFFALHRKFSVVRNRGAFGSGFFL